MSAIEERKEPIKLTRAELYQAVWETPLIHLAKQYGITGNGLALRLRQLSLT